VCLLSMVYDCLSYTLLSRRKVTWRDKLSTGDKLREGECTLVYVPSAYQA
jgi:hypothetical protein